MPTAWTVVQFMSGLTALGCCLYVQIKMLPNNERTRGTIFMLMTAAAVAALVTILCIGTFEVEAAYDLVLPMYLVMVLGGVAPLLTLLYGIRKQREWRLGRTYNPRRRKPLAGIH